jgi:hypothetical protein
MRKLLSFVFVSWATCQSTTRVSRSALSTKELRLNASLILMSCSIHLEGKNQIVDEVDEHSNPLILLAIIRILQSKQYPGIRSNLKVCLTNVAELPRGFSDITR